MAALAGSAAGSFHRMIERLSKEMYLVAVQRGTHLIDEKEEQSDGNGEWPSNVFGWKVNTSAAGGDAHHRSDNVQREQQGENQEYGDRVKRRWAMP